MGRCSWKTLITRRTWNPLSLFCRNKNYSQLLWKWLIPKPFFSLHKNKLIQAAHNTHHRLAASPEWASPLLAQGEETMKMQVNQALASRRLSFELEESCSILATAGFPFKECEVVAMETKDPYMELVCSMEEMLEVYGVKGEEGKLDWDCLENLLAWYLRVNSDRIHDFIVSAFVDVCFSLLSSADDKHRIRRRKPIELLRQVREGCDDELSDTSSFYSLPAPSRKPPYTLALALRTLTDTSIHLQECQHGVSCTTPLEVVVHLPPASSFPPWAPTLVQQPLTQHTPGT